MKYLKLFVIVFIVSLFASCSEYYSRDVSGSEWTVYFDWTYGTSGDRDIEFYSNGSTSWGGTWDQSGSSISWSFNTATYEGRVSSSSMSGTCSNTAGDTGTWTADRI